MSTLKKAFRGYRTADVDELLHNLEAQLESATSRNNVLEEQLSGARTALDEARETVYKMEERLAESEVKFARANRERERLRAELSQKQNPAEAIGGIYIKAFENGREIIASSKTHTEQFLANIENATDKAGEHFSVAEKDFVDTAVMISGIVAEINRQTEFLKQRLTELTSHAGAIGVAYRDFEHVKSEVNTDIGEIQRNYDHMISDFLSSRPVSFIPSNVPQQEATAPTEVPMEEALQKSDAMTDGAPQLEVEQTAETMEPEASVEQQPLDPESSVNAPAEEEIDKTELVDTASDFRDEEDSEIEDEPEEVMGEIKEKREEAARGQNIMNLLSKYQKR